MTRNWRNSGDFMGSDLFCTLLCSSRAGSETGQRRCGKHRPAPGTGDEPERGGGGRVMRGKSDRSGGPTRCRDVSLMLTGNAPPSNVQNEVWLGPFAGNRHRGLAGRGSKQNRNARFCFGLVWSPETGLRCVTRTATRLNQPRTARSGTRDEGRRRGRSECRRCGCRGAAWGTFGRGASERVGRDGPIAPSFVNADGIESCFESFSASKASSQKGQIRGR
jgi:hypothetical protein